MSAALPATILPRVGQLIRMFASPHDGEALNACRAVGRVLQANGATFSDLAEIVERNTPDAAPPHAHPTWEASAPSKIRHLFERQNAIDLMTAWERSFAASVAASIATSRSWRPSERQQQIIDRILAKLDTAGVWP